jgi:hypothetical protein
MSGDELGQAEIVVWRPMSTQTTSFNFIWILGTCRGVPSARGHTASQVRAQSRVEFL